MTPGLNHIGKCLFFRIGTILRGKLAAPDPAMLKVAVVDGHDEPQPSSFFTVDLPRSAFVSLRTPHVGFHGSPGGISESAALEIQFSVASRLSILGSK